MEKKRTNGRASSNQNHSYSEGKGDHEEEKEVRAQRIQCCTKMVEDAVRWTEKKQVKVAASGKNNAKEKRTKKRCNMGVSHGLHESESS